MGVVPGPVQLGLALDIALEDLLHCQPTERLAVGAQLDHVADRSVEIGREDDRDRPDPTAREPHRFHHRLQSSAPMKPPRAKPPFASSSKSAV